MTTDKRALITGITGQDGSYLTELLLARGYEVYGLVRQSSSGRNLTNLQPAFQIFGRKLVHLIAGDMTDPATIRNAVTESDPDEVYNLAAMSFVGDSWNLANYTMEVNAMGFIHLLEAVRQYNPRIRVYQASTSEMFGNAIIDGAVRLELDEESPMLPRSPYGVAKLAAHRMAAVYRESHDMHVSCGICFNHESPRRGEMFLTRKVAKAVAEIKLGVRDVVVLGDLSPKRDWGFANDYVRAMQLMLQQDDPGDYVIATGESHSVQEFVENAFDVAGISDWRSHVESSAEFFRPAEIYDLVGDPTRAYLTFGWQPRVNFRTLVEIMVQTEIEKLKLEMRGGKPAPE